MYSPGRSGTLMRRVPTLDTVRPDRFHPDTLHADKFHEECGVVGVYGHPEAANLAYLALYALQHRGQESAGIVASNGEVLIAHRGLGLVADVFNQDILARLEGRLAIGHNRYSTAGPTLLKNTQPFVVECAQGALAVAHNGNLVNAEDLRERLEARGSIFQSTSDTEVIIHLIAASPATTLVERIVAALAPGARRLLAGLPDRDAAHRGARPERLPAAGARAHRAMRSWSRRRPAPSTSSTPPTSARSSRARSSSSTSAASRSLRPFAPARRHQCVFEYVYFARPDSQVFGRNVYEVRKELGRQLARESAVPADIVIPVPDSGVPAAIGYAEEAGLPFELGLIRNHYVGRTFIEPHQLDPPLRREGEAQRAARGAGGQARRRGRRLDRARHHQPQDRAHAAAGRRARGAHAHQLAADDAPCFYGIDTPTREELIASTHSVAETREYVGADSLGYLSLPGLYAFTGGRREGFCDACFTGEYPVPLDDEHRGVRQLHLFEARERPEHR